MTDEASNHQIPDSLDYLIADNISPCMAILGVPTDFCRPKQVHVPPLHGFYFCPKELSRIMHGTEQSLAKMDCPCGTVVCFFFRFCP